MSPITSPSNGNQITEDRFQKTVLLVKDKSGNTIFGWLLKITEQEKQQIQGNARVTQTLQEWYKEMAETIHTTWTTDEITDRIEHVLRSLSS